MEKIKALYIDLVKSGEITIKEMGIYGPSPELSERAKVALLIQCFADETTLAADLAEDPSLLDLDECMSHFVLDFADVAIFEANALVDHCPDYPALYDEYQRENG